MPRMLAPPTDQEGPPPPPNGAPRPAHGVDDEAEDDEIADAADDVGAAKHGEQLESTTPAKVPPVRFEQSRAQCANTNSTKV